MANNTFDEENEPKLHKLIRGIKSFFQLMREGYWGEVGIRVGIFVLLVFLVHFIIIWIFYNIVIPYLQAYFYDSMLEIAKRRLEAGDLANIDLKGSLRF